MRNEFAQIGYGNAMKQIGYAAGKIKEDPNNRGATLIPDNDAEAAAAGVKTVSQLRREALDGAQPGQLVGGRHETIDALAPEMHKRIEEAANASAVSAGGMESFIQELAQTAGLHDSMGQGKPP
jgi:hypothetical protein